MFRKGKGKKRNCPLFTSGLYQVFLPPAAARILLRTSAATQFSLNVVFTSLISGRSADS